MEKNICVCALFLFSVCLMIKPTVKSSEMSPQQVLLTLFSIWKDEGASRQNNGVVALVLSFLSSWKHFCGSRQSVGEAQGGRAKQLLLLYFRLIQEEAAVLKVGTPSHHSVTVYVNECVWCCRQNWTLPIISESCLWILSERKLKFGASDDCVVSINVCLFGTTTVVCTPGQKAHYSFVCKQHFRNNKNLNFPPTLSDFSTTRAKKKNPNLNTSVNFPSRFFLQRVDRLCGAAMQHPSVTTSAISSQRWNDMEIIGTKRLPACHGMQSVLYIHMYWTQTCHRLWQPHSSHTKPILSAAQCAPSVPPPSPILSDSVEMNIRTPWVCIQMICFSASHWSQFSEANKPGLYFMAEMGWAPWVGATEGGESVKSWEISNSSLRPKCFQSWWRSARSICIRVQQRSPLIWHPLDLSKVWRSVEMWVPSCCEPASCQLGLCLCRPENAPLGDF